MRGRRPLAWFGEFTKSFCRVDPFQSDRYNFMMEKLVASRKFITSSTESSSNTVNSDKSKTKEEPSIIWGINELIRVNPHKRALKLNIRTHNSINRLLFWDSTVSESWNLGKIDYKVRRYLCRQASPIFKESSNTSNTDLEIPRKSIYSASLSESSDGSKQISWEEVR